MAATYCTYPDLVSSPPRKAGLKNVSFYLRKCYHFYLSLRLLKSNSNWVHAFVRQVMVGTYHFIFMSLDLKYVYFNAKQISHFRYNYIRGENLKPHKDKITNAIKGQQDTNQHPLYPTFLLCRWNKISYTHVQNMQCVLFPIPPFGSIPMQEVVVCCYYSRPGPACNNQFFCKKDDP